MTVVKQARWRLSMKLAKWGLAGALTAVGIGMVPGSSRGQADTVESAVNRTYLNKPLIHLPIEIDAGYRSQISSLVLYAKEGASGTWSIRDKAAPMQTSFTFRAPQDGEYWFRIVAIDTQGRSHPDDLSKDIQDSVVVVVDTAQPALELTYIANNPEGQIVRCESHDVNPDVLKLQFYFQTRDQVWRTLEPLPDQPNVYCIPSQAALTNFIRVVAADLAGNTTARTANLSELAAAAPKVVAAATAPPARTPTPTAEVPSLPQAPPAIAAPPVNPAAAATVMPGNVVLPSQPVAAAPTMMSPPVSSTPQAPVAPASNRINVVAAPSFVAAAPTAPTPAAPTPAAPIIVEILDDGRNPRHNITAPNTFTGGPSLEMPTMIKPAVTGQDIQTTAGTLAKQTDGSKAQLVATTLVYLNYAVENIGVSGVGRMEIYASSDRCQSWQKVGEENGRKNPAEVRLPGEGLYAIKAVISNGRGFGAHPPQAGDPADWWVEVDTSKPRATITGIRPGGAGEAGSLHVFWHAEDKNLNNDSVELYYAPSREGPWSPIAKNIRNSGQHRWQPPADAGAHAFIRLLVRDHAGNVGLSETTQPVPLDDLSRPRVRLITVTPSPATSAVPPTSGIQPVQATSTTSSLGVEVR